jgi:hypothetical protein
MACQHCYYRLEVNNLFLPACLCALGRRSPHLAAASRQLLLSNGLPASSFAITSRHPTTLQLGRDLPCICNCLIADVINDGVLSGGFIPAVSHALDELLVRADPVLVPTALTVMAQAVGVRPSGCEVHTGKNADGCEVGCEDGARRWLDLSALDKHRWAMEIFRVASVRARTLLSSRSARSTAAASKCGCCSASCLRQL